MNKLINNLKRTVLFSSLLLVSVFAFAQNDENVLEALRQPLDVSVSQTSIKIDKESRPVFTVYIAATEKAASKAWKKYFEDKYTVSFGKEKGFLMAESVTLTDVTPTMGHLYGKVATDEKGCRLDMAFNMGEKFLSESDNPEVAAKFKNVMTSFVNEFYVGWYDEVLEDERKKVSKAQKDLDKEIKTEAKLVKDIEGKEKDGVKAEEDIVKSEQAIAELQAKIKVLKADIITFKSEKEALQKTKETQIELVKTKTSALEEMNKKLEMIKVNADKIKAGI